MGQEVDDKSEVVLPFPFDHFFFCFFAEPPAAGAMFALVLRRSGWESKLLVMGSREGFRERER